MQFDEIDRKILAALQADMSESVERLGEKVGLSRNACWRRLKRLEDEGHRGQGRPLGPRHINLGLTVFIAIRTDRHDPEWLEAFANATRSFPEIQAVYRTSGELDYLVKARVPDVASYDSLYQRLIRMVRLTDVSASFVMEEIKETTALPLTYICERGCL